MPVHVYTKQSAKIAHSLGFVVYINVWIMHSSEERKKTEDEESPRMYLFKRLYLHYIIPAFVLSYVFRDELRDDDDDY